jgi:hypothetical protein
VRDLRRNRTVAVHESNFTVHRFRPVPPEAAPPRATTPEPMTEEWITRIAARLEAFDLADLFSEAHRKASQAIQFSAVADLREMLREVRRLRTPLAAPAPESGAPTADIVALVDAYRSALIRREANCTVETSRAAVAAAEALLASLAALTERATRAEERERELRGIGGQLANCAFNLAQNKELPIRTRDSLDECRKLWDALCEQHITDRASLPSDPSPTTQGKP